MYLILFFAHKNTDYKANTHLFTPQDATTAYLNYSKAGRSRRMAKHQAKVLNGLQAALKSWFCAEVEKGLQTAEGQTMMATDGRRASVGG
jgi:hypothetical protein